MKILFIGDIVGQPGRLAVKEALELWKLEHQPDIIIANAENSAGGMGANPKTLDELLAAGVDAFTMGDHVRDQPFDRLTEYPIVRPANTGEEYPGVPARTIPTPAGSLYLMNCLGFAFLKSSGGNYYEILDQLLDTDEARSAGAILLDFHAEATSEKQAVGFYLDGRVSAVLGTHTHTSTADTRLLPQGTAYQTDVGMSGALDSVLGWNPQSSISWLHKELGIDRPYKGEALQTARPYFCDAVLIETDNPTKATSIRRLTTRPTSLATT